MNSPRCEERVDKFKATFWGGDYSCPHVSVTVTLRSLLRGKPRGGAFSDRETHLSQVILHSHARP